MPAALVIGSDGLIGRTLVTHLAGAGWRVTSTTRREILGPDQRLLDLRDPMGSLPGWSDQLRVPGLVAIITAAVTGYARCAEDPVGTRRVNVDNTILLAREFLRSGAFVVYLSSNAVFDGSSPQLPEDAPHAPDTEYGKQKAACEAGLREASATFSSGLAIVRLTKVVDKSQALLAGWVREMRTGVPVRAATDLVLSPVSSRYVVESLATISALRHPGIYHLSGKDDVTYFNLATSLAASIGGTARVEEDQVRPRLGNVPSPLFSALGMLRTARILDIHPQPLPVVVGDLLETDSR